MAAASADAGIACMQRMQPAWQTRSRLVAEAPEAGLVKKVIRSVAVVKDTAT